MPVTLAIGPTLPGSFQTAGGPAISAREQIYVEGF